METFRLEESKNEPTTLIWSHLSVTSQGQYQRVKNSNAGKLLNNVSGMVKSNEILAVLGASGVGR